MRTALMIPMGGSVHSTGVSTVGKENSLPAGEGQGLLAKMFLEGNRGISSQK